MSNSKISALPTASTPLAGTEILPVVQGGITEQVSVANLTAGRQVDAKNVTATGGKNEPIFLSYSTYNANSWVVGDIFGGYQIYSSDTSGAGAGIKAGVTLEAANTTGSLADLVLRSPSSTATTGNNIERFRLIGGASNLAQGKFSNLSSLSIDSCNTTFTAGNGIDFSGNTPLAGKTSTILNWYEEGTWTPNQGAGLTLVGAFSSTGRYTRIGRQVSISGTVTGATSAAVTAAGVITSNLPFTVVTAGHGGATNAANNASSTVICTGTSVTSAAAIAATATITFSATYFV